MKRSDNCFGPYVHGLCEIPQNNSNSERFVTGCHFILCFLSCLYIYYFVLDTTVMALNENQKVRLGNEKEEIGKDFQVYSLAASPNSTYFLEKPHWR